MSDYVVTFSKEQLARLPEDDQREVMESWFRERYENPDYRTPYDSEEGGYVYVWGGPVQAGETLLEEFEGIVPERVIKDLERTLDAECSEWVPVPSADDYDEAELPRVEPRTSVLGHLSESLRTVRGLLDLEPDEAGARALRNLLYANAVAILEAYLAGTFLNAILTNDDALRKFVETTPEFKTSTVPLSEVFSAVEGARDRAKQHLARFVWHRLGPVHSMFRNCLEVDINEGLGEIANAVHVRHDIVHRNGMTTAGVPVAVTKEDVGALLKSVEDFATNVDRRLFPEPEF